MIRGAIAFGLVLRLNDDDLIEDVNIRTVITTTALCLVIGSTLIFGTMMPLVQKALVPPKEEDKHEYDDSVKVDGGNGVDDVEANRASNDSDKRKINKTPVARHSEHEELLHPNAMRDSNYEANDDPVHRLS